MLIGDEGGVKECCVKIVLESACLSSESEGIIILRCFAGLPRPFPILLFLLLEIGDGSF